MKLLLAQLTATAMVAITSASEPSSFRGGSDTDTNNVYATTQATSCEDGFDGGVNDVKQMWKNKPFYSNCDNVWSLEDKADDLKNDDYPENGSDWRMDTFNDCGRNGVDDQVDKIEKECLYDDTSQCNELGNAAAELVVMNNFCQPNRANSQSTESNPDYKKECIDDATDVCEGNIKNVAGRWCPNETLNGGKLSDMKAKCGDQVEDMVGYTPPTRNTPRPTKRPTKRPSPNRNTPRPTKRPTRRPTKRPSPNRNTPRPNDNADDCGSDGKCGRCKEAYCPDVTERKECKERNCSLGELAIFFPEDMVSEE